MKVFSTFGVFAIAPSADAGARRASIGTDRQKGLVVRAGFSWAKPTGLALICGAAVVLAAWVDSARATPVDSIALGNGQVLSIQGDVGTGSNTAFLVVDFTYNTPAGPSYAWEYNWSGTQYESDMISAVAASSSLAVFYDPTYGSALIDNFNYGTNVGSADYNGATDPTGSIYWANYYAPYDSSTKSVDFALAPLGNTTMQLGTLYDSSGNPTGSAPDMFYGWTINDYPTVSAVPNVPTVPEPRTLTIVVLGIAWLLARCPRRRA